MDKTYPHQYTPNQKLSHLRRLEGELESMLALLYKDCVGHTLTSVQCTFLNTLDLYIYMEGTHSPCEIFLEAWGSLELVKRMRQAINQIMAEKIDAILKRDLNIKIQDIKRLKPDRTQQLNILVNFQL